MTTLPHRDASGALESLWEYDPNRRAVIVWLSGRFALVIPVCSEARPSPGSFSLSRKGETTWQIAPSRFSRMGKKWFAIAGSYDDIGTLSGEFLALTHAPAKASAEMDRL